MSDYSFYKILPKFLKPELNTVDQIVLYLYVI